ncbi:MAG: hypothetical protein ACFCU5_17595 [Pleurocapsa sp.]
MLQSNYSPNYQSQVQHSDAETVIADSQSINIQAELEALEELILHGTHIPLTELIILDQGLLLDCLDKIKEHLPVELASAVEIVNRRQQIITEAENYARQLVESAQEQADAIVQEEAIVRQAELEAAKMKLKIEAECDRAEAETKAEIEQWRELAKAECREIQSGADQYADRVLSNLEQQFNEMLVVIKEGREQLSEG